MPRAFLITHRRYNAPEDGDQREPSPEHKVSVGSGSSAPNYDRGDDSSSLSSDCPDELYNLTKLAEVSLAAAAGQLYHHRHLAAVPPQPPAEPPEAYPTYTHKLFDRSIRNQRNQPQVSAAQACPEDPHECPDCGKRYSTSSNLARHRQTHRSLADKKARRCPHCDKVYVSMPAFSMHVRTHNQGCRCHFCGKCFSRPWLLQGHIRTHTGEKPFKCTVCQKAFADKSNLRAHIQTHSNTKPHVCGRCGKAFALKSYLYKHEESSCMRGQRQEAPPTSAPTPVIVRSDQPYRSSVISPNPERLLYSRVERPAAGLQVGKLCSPTDQPVDFSTRDAFAPADSSSAGYAVGLAIAV